jgi:SAM-dependent methyltransferase
VVRAFVINRARENRPAPDRISGWTPSVAAATIGPVTYDEVLAGNRDAYDGNAGERDATVKPAWKIAERAAFLARMNERKARTLIEIGAGTGQDSAFFAAAGLDVLAVDASGAMLERCAAKGLRTLHTDVRNLPDGRFDAAYSLNCLLHVPNADLPGVLRRISEICGIFYLGLWGGESFEGTRDRDHLVPKRFFSFRTDDEIRGYAEAAFEIVDFHSFDVDGLLFQSLTLTPKG